MMAPRKMNGPSKSMMGLKRPLMLLVVKGDMYRGRLNMDERLV